MTNDSLIEELQEDLRHERLRALWKEYGPYIIGGVALAVLLTGLMSTWRAWQTRINTEQTAIVMEALAADDAPAALDKAAPGLRPGHRALAWLNAGGALLADGKKEEALAIYRKAAADSALPEPYHGLAQLLSVRLAWGMNKNDPDPKALIGQLAPLVQNPNSPWQWHAGIQAALIAAHDLHDYGMAHGYLSSLLGSNGNDVPDSLRERARALDDVYKIKAGQEKPAG